MADMEKCDICLVSGILAEDIEGHKEWHRTMTNRPAHEHPVLGPPKVVTELHLQEIALLPEDQVLPEWRGITKVANITPVVQHVQHKATCAVFSTHDHNGVPQSEGEPFECDCGAVGT